MRAQTGLCPAPICLSELPQPQRAQYTLDHQSGMLSHIAECKGLYSVLFHNLMVLGPSGSGFWLPCGASWQAPVLFKPCAHAR